MIIHDRSVFDTGINAKMVRESAMYNRPFFVYDAVQKRKKDFLYVAN